MSKKKVRSDKGIVRVRFCPKGHDKNIVGIRGRQCIGCIKELKRKANLEIKSGKHKVQYTSNICIRGHDMLVLGRYKNGGCMACRKERHLEKYTPHPIKAQFCIHGHDTFICGRTNSRQCKECSNNYMALRSATDVSFKLAHNLRTRLARAIKKTKKVGSFVKDLGCSIGFLKKYIQTQFYGGMTWGNWGTYWELDHSKELWEFDLTDREQFLRAANYKNLQPLTIPDHEKKSAEGLKRKAIRNKKRG